MGVMACSKKGCDNVMCDRYSSKYGYICNECFDQLVFFYSVGFTDIELFMNSEKGNKNASYAYLNEIFGG